MKPIPSTPENRGWMPAKWCDGCDRVRLRTVTVGKASEHNSRTATLCRACLVEALAALDATP